MTDRGETEWMGEIEMAQNSFLSKLLNFIGVVDKEDTDSRNPGNVAYSDEYYEAHYQPRSANRQGSYRRTEGRRTPPPESNRYADTSLPAERRPARQSREIQVAYGTEVFYIKKFEDCSGAMEALIRGNSVILNLEEVSQALSQRVVDVMSGAAFALQANVRKIAEYMYLIAPQNVKVNEKNARNMERRY